MYFSGKIQKDKSYDPYFKVAFSYESDGVKIENGCADIVRKAPKPEITYDAATGASLERVDKSKLELELLNLVIDFIFNKRDSKLFNG